MRKTITKDIPTTTVRAAVYNIDTDSVSDREYTLYGKFINDKALKKALDAVVDPKDRIIHVKDTTSTINVCCMPLETFLEHSIIEASKVVKPDEAADGNEDD